MADSNVPSGRNAAPTMRDVALKAGVSVKTVSRVVNGGHHVSSEKQRAVERAIAQLRFHRNDFARGLRSGGTNSVGLLIEDVADPFYSTMTRAIEDVVLGEGRLLLTASSEENVDRARRLIQLFSERRLEGLIITPPNNVDAERLRAEIGGETAVVFVDRPVPGVEADTVLADNVGGAILGIEHLLAQGHRRIAFFGDQDTIFTASERLLGYRRALSNHDIAFDPDLVFMQAPGGAVDHLEAIEEVLSRATAVFAANNRWSLQLLRHSTRARDEIAFVGFDDFEYADLLRPGITVVAQSPGDMGREAARLLFSRLQRKDDLAFQTVTLGTRLIERGSGERG